MISFILQSVTKNMILFNEKLITLPCLKFMNVRNIHLTSNIMKEFRSGFSKVRANTKRKNVVMEGEKAIDFIDVKS